MSLREKVAFTLWRAEAIRAAPNVAKRRTPESFLNDTQDSDRNRWLLNADAAIAAVMEALEEPSEAVWDGLPRDLMMWMDMSDRTPRGLFQHLKGCRGKVPEWLRKEPEMQNLDHTPSKGTRAVLVWKAMLRQFKAEQGIG